MIVVAVGVNGGVIVVAVAVDGEVGVVATSAALNKF